MRIFDQLRALRDFEKQHFKALKTVEDYEIIREIGHRQTAGMRPTIKQLLLLDVGSVATVQRRLRRLKAQGVIQHHRSRADRRSIELSLSPSYLRAFARYEDLIALVASGGNQTRKNSAPATLRDHACAVYGCHADFVRIAVQFLSQGLQQGDACGLFSSSCARDAILSNLTRRQRRSTDPVLTDSLTAEPFAVNPNAQLNRIRRFMEMLKSADGALRLVIDTAAALDQGWSVEQVADYETRLEKLLSHQPVKVLCLYDGHRFTCESMLDTLRQHSNGAGSVEVLL